MSRFPRSTSTAGAVRRGVAALCLTFFATVPASADALLFESVETDEWLDRLHAPFEFRLVEPAHRFLDLIRQPFEGPLFRANHDWRAQGLAYVDLPLRIRARFDANYSRFRTRPDHLASRHVAEVGPGLRFDRHIESRVALTRPLVEGIELELVWETRNRIEAGDPMAFGRQVVGAMVRITP